MIKLKINVDIRSSNTVVLQLVKLKKRHGENHRADHLWAMLLRTEMPHIQDSLPPPINTLLPIPICGKNC